MTTTPPPEQRARGASFNLNSSSSILNVSSTVIDKNNGSNVSSYLQITGSGTMNLLNTANTYSGATYVNGGTLNVAALALGGSSSSIGASSNAASNLVLGGGSLQYTGSTPQTTNRLFTISGAALGTLTYAPTATIDASGTGSGTLTFSNTGAVAFGDTQPHTFTLTGSNTGANTLAPTISDNTGTTSLVKSGTGTWYLTGTGSSFTGTTTINAGILNVASLAVGGSNSSIGASANSAANLVFGGGTLQYTGSTAQTTDRLFTISGAGDTATLDASGTGSGTLSFTNTGSIAFGDTNAHTLTLTGTNTGANSLSALIGDNTGLTSLVKNGTGTWYLTNPLYVYSTYTGTTTINGGTLNADYLANGGSTSSIGAATNAASNLVFGGGSLQYTGSVAASTDRLFTIGDANGNTATLDASGSTSAATVTFSNTGTLTFGNTSAHTLTLTGSNTSANTFSPVINDNAGGGATSLVKNGTGTWTVRGSNGFSGGTTINAGTLQIATVAASGTPQPLGTGSTLRLGGTSTSGTLLYTGGTGNLGQNVIGRCRARNDQQHGRRHADPFGHSHQDRYRAHPLQRHLHRFGPDHRFVRGVRFRLRGQWRGHRDAD